MRPAAVIAWHRRGFALFWAWKSRRVGRPPLAAELVRLIERMGSVLDMYKLDVGSYPTTDQGLQARITSPPGVARWNGPYMKGNKLPEDPWGHPFQYRNPSQRPGYDYDLYSLGPTGQSGGTAAPTILNE